MSTVNIVFGSALAGLFAVATAPAAGADGQQGMVVARDPQTGELRAPTADERRELRQQAGAFAPEPVQATVRSDGSRHVHMGERGQVYSVMSRDASGELVMQCVSGEHAAESATRRPAPAAPKKGAQHETE